VSIALIFNFLLAHFIRRISDPDSNYIKPQESNFSGLLMPNAVPVLGYTVVTSYRQWFATMV